MLIWIGILELLIHTIGMSKVSYVSEIVSKSGNLSFFSFNFDVLLSGRQESNRRKRKRRTFGHLENMTLLFALNSF